jgi:hypothetical protein
VARGGFGGGMAGDRRVAAGRAGGHGRSGIVAQPVLPERLWAWRLPLSRHPGCASDLLLDGERSA